MQSPIRYCFVLPQFDETQNSFSKLLAPVLDALKADGHAVTILSANRSYQGPYRNHHHSIRVPRLKPAFLSYLAFVIFSSLWLKKRRSSFDIIHNLGVGTTLVQDVMTAHACHRAWIARKRQLGQYFSLVFNPLHLLIFLVESFNYRRNVPVIAVCQKLGDEIVRYYPFVKERLTIVNNGVENPRVDFTKPRFDSSIGSRFTISFASNDHGKKGLGEILSCLQKAKEEGRQWLLVVLGHDKNQAFWERQIETMGLKGEVNFLGHVKGIRDEMARSDVFCLPSYYEAFGLVFVEAAQANRPVIGTNVGIYPTLVQQNFEDLPLALPIDLSALYRVLKRTEDDKSWATRLTQEVKSVAAQFTEQAMVKGTLQFYEASSKNKLNRPLRSQLIR